MNLIGYLVTGIFIVPILSMTLFAFLVSWATWFTGETLEYTEDKVWKSVTGIGVLIVFFVYQLHQLNILALPI